MVEILRIISEAWEKGNFIGILIAFLIIISFNWKKIIDYYDNRKKSKVTTLTETLKSEHLTGNTKEYIKEVLETEQFRLIAGIRLEKENRETLLQAYFDVKEDVSFLDFKRILPYFEIKEGKFFIKISLINKFAFLFLCITGISLLISSTVLSLYVILCSDALTSQEVGKAGIYSFIYFIVAFILLTQLLPYFSAKKIEKALKEHRINIPNKNNYVI